MALAMAATPFFIQYDIYGRDDKNRHTFIRGDRFAINVRCQITPMVQGNYLNVTF